MNAVRRSLGAAELDVLTYVSEEFPVSVREVKQGLIASHGYARTTVLTVLERLRRKGYLTRERKDGVNSYRPSLSQRRLMNLVVSRFVEEMLGGSVSPILDWIEKTGKLTADEMVTLKAIIRRLEAGA